MEAEEAIRGVNDIRGLIDDGRMELIAKRYGKAKQQEAFHFILEIEVLPIWSLTFARYKKKKALKRAARKKLAAQTAAMELPEERAAVIADVAPWDAKWAAENPVGQMQTPGSHMVCRALVQTVLIDKLKKENELRLGGHNMGLTHLTTKVQ
jgi:hypothetical protein